MIEETQYKVWRSLQAKYEIQPEGACSICRGLGMILCEEHAYHCLCVRERVFMASMKTALNDAMETVPITSRTLDFSAFDDYSHATAALKFAPLVARGESIETEDGKTRAGLFLYGDTGSGKSTLAYLICLERLAQFEPTAWTDYLRFVKRVQATYRPKSEQSAEEIIRAVMRSPFLVIDDLGAGRYQQSGDRIEIMFEVFNYRSAHHLPTVITSNMRLADIETNFDRRIRSRIEGMCHAVEMTGKDFRVG